MTLLFILIKEKKLLSLSSNVSSFTQCIIKSFFFIFIIQGSARDYDSQDRRKLLTVSSY